jgi:hypothetical protein
MRHEKWDAPDGAICFRHERSWESVSGMDEVSESELVVRKSLSWFPKISLR